MIKPIQLSEMLEAHTAKVSKFDTSRDYISMSHAILSVNEIIAQVREGFQDTMAIRLKCYKGYQMEKDLLQRLKEIFEGTNRLHTGTEISAFNGQVKGHPDFEFDGFPGDCKTVPLDEYLPTGRVPKRVYYQMQAYMRYSLRDKAIVIYESRESGRIVDFWLSADRRVQSEINLKYEEVLKQLYK